MCNVRLRATNTSTSAILGLFLSIMALGLLQLPAGCAMAQQSAAAHVAHPNQINDADGYTYDTLLTAKAVLDQAKVEFRAGQLPAAAYKPIQDADAIYANAYADYKLWRDVENGLQPGDQSSLWAKVSNDLQDVVKSVATIRKIGGSKL